MDSSPISVSRSTRQRFRFPARWLNYSPVGKIIPGTRFLAFKTPLKRNFFEVHGRQFDMQSAFDIKTLLDLANTRGKKIGLVIDLTNSDRYYNPSEWIDAGVNYEKIRCIGRGTNISEESVKKFYSIVSSFLSQHIYTGELIGVHCTHGLNRTGFMICRYLVEVDNWDVNCAIQHFEYCRGYKIERKEYIYSLKNNCIKGKYPALSVQYPEKEEISNICVD
ncbi:unnamed protein product [Thelazia callipaeda]|uniref:TYR_PHOSPHATASE_2 domain-containing protein n=1 Tax=Thelazia callipaeda TaxID=103827 RepID=A0A0N5D4R1_THECL|nr:unnamed protein product [Thelazia callipaeda]